MTTSEATQASTSDVKEVQMDMPQEGGGTRRRRRARRAKTQRGGSSEDAMSEQAPTHAVTVEKAHSTTPSASVPVKALTPEPATPAPQVGGRSAKPTVAKQLAAKRSVPIVVLAPAKKQAKARLMLVSKKATAGATATHTVPPKTFKAKRVRVTIDNTARTQKRRRQVLRSVDSLTEEQLHEQAVKFGLSRTDSVKKVPQDLLRKMLKDYYAMRKGFL